MTNETKQVVLSAIHAIKYHEEGEILQMCNFFSSGHGMAFDRMKEDSLVLNQCRKLEMIIEAEETGE